MIGQIAVFSIALVICAGIAIYACFMGLALIKSGLTDISWSGTRFGDTFDRYTGVAAIAGGGVIIVLGALFSLSSLVGCWFICF